MFGGAVSVSVVCARKLPRPLAPCSSALTPFRFLIVEPDEHCADTGLILNGIKKGKVASFYVENFGCRATQADGAAIERQFEERGLPRASAAAQSEIVVLNTCTVTAAADQDARAAIRRIRRENPDCQIVVTGCYAQRAPEEVAALPGVNRVIGNSHKAQLVEIVFPRQADGGTSHASNSSFVPL